MADGQFSETINGIVEELTSDECKRVFYLCGILDTDKGVDDLRGMLTAVMNRGEADHMFLPELMFRIRRYDILKKKLHTSKSEVERILGNGLHVPLYRVLMADISEALGKEDLDSLKCLLSATLPKGRMEKSTSFLDIVVELEKLGMVSCDDLALIERCLRTIHRVDLAKKIQRYRAGGQLSPTGFDVHSPIGSPCSPRNLPGVSPFVPPVHHNTQQCVTAPTSQALENLPLAVPETGGHHSQSSVEVYRMWAEPRGTCLIIDCVGSDGDMLEQTFRLLHFRVLLCKWPSLAEVRSTLLEVSRRGELQRDDAFVCCIISRATSTHLLATELEGPGMSFDSVRRLFSAEACPGLAGKPKLFFIQSYSATGLWDHHRNGYRDEDLETDSPTTACATESIPTDADIFWSLCWTDEWQLQQSEHGSVYLQALSAALLKGQRRELSLLDVHTEVNAVIYEQRRSDPGETYSVRLQHTLRKMLFIL